MNNEVDTKKKLLHNVWRSGDNLFSTGDLVTMDEFGWLYFQVGHDSYYMLFLIQSRNMSILE